MESTDFVVWTAFGGGKYCTLEGLLEVDDVYQITEGRPRAQGFPKAAHFRMNRRFPKEVALADSLANANRLLVVSKRLRDLLEARATPRVEYLPVSIHDHKKRVASADYSIVNPLAIVDAIDRGASDISWNRIDPEFISGIMSLVLRADRLDPALPLFRLEHTTSLFLLRRHVADEMNALGFTGNRFVELAEFQR